MDKNKKTNSYKVVRCRRYDYKSGFHVLKALRKLNELRTFFQINEINNDHLWELIDNVEYELVGNKFD